MGQDCNTVSTACMRLMLRVCTAASRLAAIGTSCCSSSEPCSRPFVALMAAAAAVRVAAAAAASDEATTAAELVLEA